MEEDVKYSGRKPGDDETMTSGQFVHMMDKTLKSDPDLIDDKVVPFILSRLTGPAADFALELVATDGKMADWSLLKSELVKRFGVRLKIREKVELRKSLVQITGETVKEYIERCEQAQFYISDDLVDVTFEREVLLNFLLGLRQDLRDEIFKNSSAEANSLEDFLAAAVEAEKYIDTYDGDIKPSIKLETGEADGETDYKVEPPDMMDTDFDPNGFGDDDEDPDFEVDYSKIKSSNHKSKFYPSSSSSASNSALGILPPGSKRGVQCEVCCLKFKTKELLLEHVDEEHDAKDCDGGGAGPLKCEYCSASFRKRAILRRHLDHIHPDKSIKCTECGGNFSGTKRYAYHLANKHCEKTSNGAAVCLMCRAEHKRMANLKWHILKDHLQWTGEHICNVCSKSFSCKYNLEQHIRYAHLMEKPFRCDLCDGKGYVSQSGLEYHQRSAHGLGRKFQCDKCSKQFNSQQAVDEHVARYHNTGSFICEECGRTFNIKKDLKIHIYKTHTGLTKTKQCTYYPECKTLVRDEYDLKRHVKRVHEKSLKKYNCDYCPKKFDGQDRREDHINGVHLNRKPHKCPHCDFVTAYRGKIRLHVKSSHSGAPPPPPVKHTCPFENCPEETRTQAKMDKHIRQDHGIKDWPIPQPLAVPDQVPLPLPLPQQQQQPQPQQEHHHHQPHQQH